MISPAVPEWVLSVSFSIFAGSNISYYCLHDWESQGLLYITFFSQYNTPRNIRWDGSGLSNRKSKQRLMLGTMPWLLCANLDHQILFILSANQWSPPGKYVLCYIDYPLCHAHLFINGQTGIYHHVTGIDASSSASLAAYITTLTVSSADKTAKIVSGIYWYLWFTPLLEFLTKF